ncbi:AraC family transcriptional regulator [Pontibacter sp. G13]|uniref:AraC family transcriptional regulator n=1 Tax=Pontibacter sp. G13 TaxID=3074898 RepID=UPI00288C025E|nr:AraC family transcriptional regulator [Pontibacter sp. G13]WNJ20305.1 AraC family transcriptional regulator [Pontibacter sp. G13]
MLIFFLQISRVVSFKQEHFELNGKVFLGRATFQPPFKAHASLHDEARFVGIIHGSSRIYVPNHQEDLKDGDCFLMNTDNFVNHWLMHGDDEPIQVIIMHLMPDLLRYVYDDKMPEVFSRTGGELPKSLQRITPNLMLSHFMQGMVMLFDHRRLANEEILKLKVRELIQVLLQSDVNGTITAMLGGLFRTPSYDFKEIIHSHLYEDLSVEDLAFFAGMSLSSFKRKFKTVFDSSPNQYIKTKRLIKAQELLQSTELRISDIAYDVGFNDIGYFSKLFKAAFQMSPSEYRKAV